MSRLETFFFFLASKFSWLNDSHGTKNALSGVSYLDVRKIRMLIAKSKTHENDFFFFYLSLSFFHRPYSILIRFHCLVVYLGAFYIFFYWDEFRNSCFIPQYIIFSIALMKAWSEFFLCTFVPSVNVLSRLAFLMANIFFFNLEKKKLSLE